MLIAAFAAAAAPFAEAREWKLESGKITSGEFIEVIDDEGVQKIRIRKEDGQITRVNLTSLSEEDRKFVEKRGSDTSKVLKMPLLDIHTLFTEAKKDNPDAMYELASRYQSGSRGVKYSDLDKMGEWIRKGAKHAASGSVAGWICKGLCYYEGIDVEKDETKAMKWFLKAVDAGDVRMYHIFGNFSLGADNTKAAVQWFQKAAEQGYVHSQFRLGGCYQIGKGVIRDREEAVKWFRKAAEQGYDEAQNELGFCCLRGIGTAKDEAEAFGWFQKAAEQGYVPAQRRLGICYSEGKGVTKDDKEAVKWLRKAAFEGDDAMALQHPLLADIVKAREESAKMKERKAERKAEELRKQQAARSSGGGPKGYDLVICKVCNGSGVANTLMPGGVGLATCATCMGGGTVYRRQ